MERITKWRIKIFLEWIFFWFFEESSETVHSTYSEVLAKLYTFVTHLWPFLSFRLPPSHLRNRNSCRYQVSAGTMVRYLPTLLLSNANAETHSVPWGEVETWVPPRRLRRIWKIHTNIDKHLPTVFSFSYASKGLSSYKMRYFAKLKFAPCTPRVNWNRRQRFALSVFAHTSLRERRVHTYELLRISVSTQWTSFRFGRLNRFRKIRGLKTAKSK